MPRTIVLSLGGSLIFPQEIDIEFLKNFKKTIGKYIKKDFRFVIYCGGGKLARDLQKTASELAEPSNEELDWLGIYATRLNAQLIKAIFKKNAEDVIVTNPKEKVSLGKKITVAAGWIPGWSTDYDAVLLAKNIGVREIVNMSNVDYVYTKDPRKFKNAEKIEKISWKKFRRLIESKWKAGMNAPFDPVAAREAQRLGIKVTIMGSDLKNLENFLENKTFKGTTIS